MKNMPLLAALWFAAAPLFAQEKDNPPAAERATQPTEGPQVVRLSLAPAAEPEPALKYELLPRPSQRSPGNAAPYYYRAMLGLHQLGETRRAQAEVEKAGLEAPLDQLPKGELATWLAAHRQVLTSLRTAAYRERCDWDLRVQDLEGMEAMEFPIHEAQDARSLAGLLRVKARLELAEGKLDDALETIRQGFQLSRDVGQQPMLVNALVALAIAGTMTDTLAEFIDQPEAPNLYWAIAGLPRPLVDIRPAMRAEMELPEKLLPFLKDAETAQRTPEQWQKLVAQGLRELHVPGGGDWRSNERDDAAADDAAAAIMARAYPIARRELAAAGFDPERLEKMPAGQVIAIQSSRALRHCFHDVFKCLLLDDSVAAQRLEEVTGRLEREGYTGSAPRKDPLGLAALLLPSVNYVHHASARLNRDLAALQAIGAIRMHAAAGGKLPASLDEITLVPVPHNPATGRAFGYLLADEEATLDAPLFSDADAVRFVLTFPNSNKK